MTGFVAHDRSLAFLVALLGQHVPDPVPGLQEGAVSARLAQEPVQIGVLLAQALDQL